MLSMLVQRRLFKVLFIFGNRKRSHGARRKGKLEHHYSLVFGEKFTCNFLPAMKREQVHCHVTGIEFIGSTLY